MLLYYQVNIDYFCRYKGLISMNKKIRFSPLLFHIILPVILFSISCEKLPLIDPSGYEVAIDADSVVFAQIGDFGFAGTAEQKVSELVKSWNPDFIVSVGDNNYYEGKLTTAAANITNYYGDYIYNYDAPEEFQCKGRAFEERFNRFFPTPGNHDANNQDGLVPYYNFFTLPHNEIYYKVIWGPVTLYSINTTQSDITQQVQWLQQETAASSTPFNIVFLHHPPFSAGPHGNHSYTQLPFDAMNIDLVFSGHDHIYERLVKDGEEDVCYIVNGLGGKATSGFDTGRLEPGVNNVFCYGTDYGAVKVVVTPSRLSMAFYTISSPDVPIDEYEIQL